MQQGKRRGYLYVCVGSGLSSDLERDVLPEPIFEASMPDWIVTGGSLVMLLIQNVRHPSPNPRRLALSIEI